MFAIDEALNTLSAVTTIDQLNAFFDTYLWKQGSLTLEFKTMGSLDPEQKKIVGQQLSDAKVRLTEAYTIKEATIVEEAIRWQLLNDIVDTSIDTAEIEGWHLSLLSRVRRESEEIFKSLWFTMEYGTEVVTKFENFESVNIPLSHPATEMQDTIYLSDKDATGENLILRTQTSSMQNYMIKKYGVPLKVVMPGKVYRYENMDATHDTMFYQLEGIIIDKWITIAHFKHLITTILSAILQKKVETRMRPGYFPFVEPGFEIDVRYEILDQATGKTYMSKWMEILGAGMIHPRVLELADVDGNVYSGFAFGIGLSRLAAVRYGIKDIRYFTNGDLRFAKSF